jgi:hypothetical protein
VIWNLGNKPTAGGLHRSIFNQEDDPMNTKLLAAAAMSLCLGATGALAQTTTGTAGTAATGTAGTVGATAGMTAQMHTQMPADWEGDIADAFYTDTEAGTLRDDEDDMRTRFDDLDEDHQARVRDYCEQFAMDRDMMQEGQADAAAGTAATGTATTGTAATGTGATGTAATGTAGQMDHTADYAAGAAHHASLERICAMIEEWDDA